MRIWCKKQALFAPALYLSSSFIAQKRLNYRNYLLRPVLQSAFSEGGLVIGAGLEDLGKGLRSQTGTLYGTVAKGTRYLELTEGYITKQFLDKDSQVCGYEYVHLGKMMEAIKNGMDANEAVKKFTGSYGRTKPEQGIVKSIDPRKE